MSPLLQQKFDELKARHTRLAHFLKEKNHDELVARPAPHSWSALEIVQHLARVEAFTASYLRKKLDRPQGLKQAGLMSGVRRRLVKVFLKTSLKFKAPAAVNEDHFITNIQLHEALSAWQAANDSLKKVLEETPETLAGLELFRHPMAGRMSLSDMLSFLGDHFDRHERQIWRALK